VIASIGLKLRAPFEGSVSLAVNAQKRNRLQPVLPGALLSRLAKTKECGQKKAYRLTNLRAQKNLAAAMPGQNGSNFAFKPQHPLNKILPFQLSILHSIPYLCDPN